MTDVHHLWNEYERTISAYKFLKKELTKLKETDKLTRAERKRLYRLSKIPKNFTCPVCFKIYLNTRQWYVGKSVVMCQSCRRGGVKKTRAQYKRESRERQLPKDRICPVCKVLKLNSRQWVVKFPRAVCRSCNFKGEA